jgi:hypothetical protein
MKSLDHTTDSGSLAGSESIVKSSGGTRATAVTARTTASHNIATKAGNFISKKNKAQKNSKGKETAPEPEPDTSDEDDSRERDAALSSPIKGKISRELNKVSQLISLVIVLGLLVIVTNDYFRPESGFGRHPSPVHSFRPMPNQNFLELLCRLGSRSSLLGTTPGDPLMMTTA